jgi:phosphoglycerate dehydrogenase-like enzyme
VAADVATSATPTVLYTAAVESRMSEADTRGVDVAVLRGDIHGRPVAEYADELRVRLLDSDIVLGDTAERERQLVARARIATGLRMDESLLSVAENLELFACAYAGTDHLPLSAFEDHGVAVTNAAGLHGPNAAEHVLGAMLAFARGFGVARRRQQRREWRPFDVDELKDSTVVVVGMGAIGTGVLERLEGFEVHRVGVRHTPEKGGPAEEVLGYDDVDDALSRAEYLALACPLTDRTRGLIDREALRTMPADAVLVNVARGPVVETEALVGALRGREIGGAALDVTDPEPLPEDHPLWTLGNVMITPHNAGNTPKYYERLADLVADNVGRLQAGEGLRNRVV